MGKLYRVLSMDGGGVRGIIPAMVLKVLESKLIKKTGDKDVSVMDYFDMVAGVNVSALIALILLVPRGNSDRPRYSTDDAIDVIMENSGNIFKVSLMHKIRTLGGLLDEAFPSDVLEKVIFSYLKDNHMSDLIRPCMISGYDIQRRKAMFFTQHDAKKGPGRDFLAREVARAAIAVPTYFELANIKSNSGIRYPCIDGGVFANNPTLCAYAEACTHFETTPKNMAILSLGTGIDEKAYHYEDAKDWGAIGWMKPLLSFMTSGISNVVNDQCRTLFEENGVGEHYLRVNVPLRDLPPGMSSEASDSRPDNLQGMQEIGMELAENMDAELDRFVDLLISSKN